MSAVEEQGLEQGLERKGSYGYRKDELANRLNRIEGQVRGISRMVGEEKYCVDILTQVAAVQAALERVSLGVLQDHLKGCVLDEQSPNHSEHGVEEIMQVLERFVALRR
ncbi:MAG: CsoR family transcriptional regulator, copper-sensing transcriptional repressor [Actinomycetota bacterium]|nr:CsoR family transcriptional regulator, copper-sensing transcriptional repressor [Actinomycetota bacterium]